MKWEMKVPNRVSNVAGARRRFCATTVCGEYSIERAGGKFSVALDGVAVTESTYATATDAMQAAIEEDNKLRGFMGKQDEP